MYSKTKTEVFSHVQVKPPRVAGSSSVIQTVSWIYGALVSRKLSENTKKPRQKTTIAHRRAEGGGVVALCSCNIKSKKGLWHISTSRKIQREFFRSSRDLEYRYGISTEMLYIFQFEFFILKCPYLKNIRIVRWEYSSEIFELPDMSPCNLHGVQVLKGFSTLSLRRKG